MSPLPSRTMQRGISALAAAALVAGAGAQAAAAAPVITALSNTQSLNVIPRTMSIYGSGFTGAESVRVNGFTLPQFTVISDTRIDIVSPNGGGGDSSISVTVGGVTSQDTPADNLYVLTGPGDFQVSVPVTCAIAGRAPLAARLRIDRIQSGPFSGATIDPGTPLTTSDLRAALSFTDGSALGDPTIGSPTGDATLDALDANLTGATTSQANFATGGPSFRLTQIGEAAPVEFNIPGTGNFAPTTIIPAAPGGGTITASLRELRAHVTYASGDQLRDTAISCTPTGAPQPFLTRSVNLVETGPVSYSYSAKGSATLKTLAKGSVPLRGTAAASLDPVTGAFKADLALDQATANLTALGFLPVVAKVAFVPTGPVTGMLAGGTLKASVVTRIKLPSVTLFGLNLGGGSTCQTKNPSNIPLTGAGFDPAAGGSLLGTFTISDLTGCGSLTGIVSSLTAGSGNAMALQLTPAG